MYFNLCFFFLLLPFLFTRCCSFLSHFVFVFTVFFSESNPFIFLSLSVLLSFVCPHVTFIRSTCSRKNGLYAGLFLRRKNSTRENKFKFTKKYEVWCLIPVQSNICVMCKSTRKLRKLCSIWTWNIFDEHYDGAWKSMKMCSSEQFVRRLYCNFGMMCLFEHHFDQFASHRLLTNFSLDFSVLIESSLYQAHLVC